MHVYYFIEKVRMRESMQAYSLESCLSAMWTIHGTGVICPSDSVIPFYSHINSNITIEQCNFFVLFCFVSPVSFDQRYTQLCVYCTALHILVYFVVTYVYAIYMYVAYKLHKVQYWQHQWMHKCWRHIYVRRTFQQFMFTSKPTILLS